VLANSDSIAGTDEKDDWHARRHAYIERFPRKSPAALRVALAVDELRRVVDAITALAEERQGPDTRVTFDWGSGGAR
jgi:hypothetical protein